MKSSPELSPSFHFAFSVAQQNYLQLEVADKPSLPQDQTPQLISEYEGYTLSAYVRLDENTTPEHLRSWIGTQVILDEQCRATVKEVHLVSRMLGELSHTPTPPQTGAQKSKAAFDAGAKVYAGKLSGCQGKYAYGRLATAPQLTFAERLSLEAGSNNAATAARKHFRTTAPSMGEQTRWRAIKGNDGHWLDNADIEVSAFANEDGKGFLVVSAHAGEYCGHFLAQWWAIYKITHYGSIDDGEIALGRLTSINAGSIDPRAAVDVDGDGTLELVAYSDTNRSVYSLDGSILTTEPRPFYGCRC